MELVHGFFSGNFNRTVNYLLTQSILLLLFLFHFLSIQCTSTLVYVEFCIPLKLESSPPCFFILFSSSILLIHEGSHREAYQEFQPSYDIFRRWCQELFRPQVPPAYTDQLLTLHQHRANNQYRTANQI